MRRRAIPFRPSGKPGGRQTLNQVRYEALEIDIDQDGQVLVGSEELTEVAEAVEAVADDVRADLGETSGDKGGNGGPGDTGTGPAGPGGPNETGRRHLPPQRPSGFHGGSRDPRDQARTRRRTKETKNPARLTGDRGSNLTNLAEGVGFEPTVSVSRHTAFREQHLQPLGHPSVSHQF